MITETAGARKAVFIDAACLALITLLSALPYITKIGFYSDDWFIVASFHDGRLGLPALLADFPSRPLQGLYLASLFKLSGTEPLGYHAVNTAIIALSAVGLYLLLIRLRFGRAEAFASAVVFLLLPQLSTVRVWVAAAQVPLSMLLALISMHAQLSFVQSRKPGLVLLAAISAIASVLAYEIFAALIIAFPVGLAFARWKERSIRSSLQSKGIAIAAATVAVALAVTAVLKVLLSERARLMKPYDYLVGAYRFFSPSYDWRVDYGPNIFAALDVYAWQTLIRWPEALATLVIGGLAFPTLVVVILSGLIVFKRMSSGEEVRPKRLALVGFAAFLLGHAVFLVLPGLMFSPSGLANRVSVAAAPGVAMLIVAALIFIVSTLPSRWRRKAIAMSVTLVVIAAMARLVFVEAHWAEASRLQNRILASAKRDLASVPTGSTVILDRVCPYQGPGVVFETWWDTGPALSLAMGRKIDGDVISERAKITPRGLVTSIYGEAREYPYGDVLYLYDPSSKFLTQLRNLTEARSYFSARRPAPCPRGFVSQGVIV